MTFVENLLPFAAGILVGVALTLWGLSTYIQRQERRDGY